MKLYFVFIFAILSSTVLSTNIVVYIDLSNNTINRDTIILKTKQIIIANQPAEFIIFISNGKEPVVIDNYASLDKALNGVMYLPNPSAPDINFDIDTLNALLTKKTFVQSNLGTMDNLSLSFFIVPDHKNETFINRLLLCNRLTNKNGLSKKVVVTIYKPKNNNSSETKKSCKIFKQRNYEIKNY